MARAVATDEQREEALRLYVEHGPAEAARRTGWRAATIRQWAHRTPARLPTRDTTCDSDTRDTAVCVTPVVTAVDERRAHTEAALAASLLSRAERTARLGDRLLVEAEVELGRLREPTREHKLSGSGKE